MQQPSHATCMSCIRRVERAGQVCEHCQALHEEWTRRPPAPIILPGTPGLSVTASTASRRVARAQVGVSLAVLAGVTITVYTWIHGQQDPFASRPEQASPAVAALAAPVTSLPPDTTPPSPTVAVPDSPASVSALAAPRLTADSASAQNLTAPREPEPQESPTVAAQSAERVETPASPTQIAPLATPDTLRGVMPSRVAVAAAPIAAATPVALPADLLDDGRIRTAVDEFIRGIRARATTNFELSEFYAEGAEHSVTLRDAPSSTTPTASSARVTIELAISKRDAVGRRFSRRLPVAMTVATRDGSVHVSAVAFGALRKP